MLVVQQGVELKGGRYYLASAACEHPDLVAKKQRFAPRVWSNYFEASTDNESVKQTFIVAVPGKG